MVVIRGSISPPLEVQNKLSEKGKYQLRTHLRRPRWKLYVGLKNGSGRGSRIIRRLNRGTKIRTEGSYLRSMSSVSLETSYV